MYVYETQPQCLGKASKGNTRRTLRMTKGGAESLIDKDKDKAGTPRRIPLQKPCGSQIRPADVNAGSRGIWNSPSFLGDTVFIFLGASSSTRVSILSALRLVMSAGTLVRSGGGGGEVCGGRKQRRASCRLSQAKQEQSSRETEEWKVPGSARYGTGRD